MSREAALLHALADDAESLAALHDRELTPDLLRTLKQSGFPASLGLLPIDDAAKAAWHAMADAITDLPDPLDSATMDALASDYADIYLTGAYGTSPCESAWTSEERLNCQAAMFEWRDLHATIGLAAADWRQRPDDHLVLQLLHVAHAARKAAGAADIGRLLRVLDDHLLLWLPAWAARVAGHSGSPFYAALAALTAAWVQLARQALDEAAVPG